VHIKDEDEHEHNRTAPPCDGSLPEASSPCIEYLQREIARLLMKNETMRFELFRLRQRVGRIERIVSCPGFHDLQCRLPAHLLNALRDLCRRETALENPTERKPASDNVISFRNS